MVERPRRKLSSSRAAIWVALFGWLVSVKSLSAQTAGAPLTLSDAVQLALKNYPALRKRRARAPLDVQAAVGLRAEL